MVSVSVALMVPLPDQVHGVLQIFSPAMFRTTAPVGRVLITVVEEQPLAAATERTARVTVRVRFMGSSGVNWGNAAGGGCAGALPAATSCFSSTRPGADRPRPASAVRRPGFTGGPTAD